MSQKLYTENTLYDLETSTNTTRNEGKKMIA